MDRFTRIHFVGYSSLWALLGAGSVAPASPRLALGLAGIGALFHFYGSVLNDVVDLPVDRTQPLRAEDPLVRGTISPRAALVFALVQVPLMLGLAAWLGGGARELAWLVGAVAAMAVYNLYGKRCPVPPLTDAAQGLAWACMTLFGARMAGGLPNRSTVCIALFGIVFTTLINGVHGGMRDLENDHSAGARTTALFLGIRPAAEGGVVVPGRAWLFCFVLEALLVVLSFAALSGAGARAGGIATGAVVLAANALCVWGLVRVLQPNRRGWDLIFRFHLVALLIPLFAAMVPPMGPAMSVFVGVLFLAPMGLLEAAQRMIDGARGRISATRGTAAP